MLKISAIRGLIIRIIDTYAIHFCEKEQNFYETTTRGLNSGDNDGDDVGLRSETSPECFDASF